MVGARELAQLIDDGDADVEDLAVVVDVGVVSVWAAFAAEARYGQTHDVLEARGQLVGHAGGGDGGEGGEDEGDLHGG